MRRFSTVARIGGAGYRQLAKIDHHWSRPIRRIFGLFQKGRLPVDLWLGRGYPLNPYLMASLIHQIRERIKPVDLRLPPDGYFVTEKVKDFLEYSMSRSWVRQWLKYHLWYYTVALSFRPAGYYRTTFQSASCEH